MLGHGYKYEVKFFHVFQRPCKFWQKFISHVVVSRKCLMAIL